jgi:ferredoxin
METERAFVLPAGELDRLLAILRRQCRLVGPRVDQGAIVYDEIETASDLPVGLGDEQSPGEYRLRRRGDGALFGYVVGPHSWKKFLHPPRLSLFRMEKRDGDWSFQEQGEAPRFALIGARSCELQAIAIQDKVFLGGPFVDKDYEARRDQVFVVAVNCSDPASTCFCTSMEGGPRALRGYDLVLTELLDEERHDLLVEVGSEAGSAVMAELGLDEAMAQDVALARGVSEAASQRIERSLDTSNVRELLYDNAEHPRWDDVAARCLACGNCTMVCPTCFCSTVEDVSDLTGDTAERVRVWDSCFTAEFSYVHGGAVRQSTRSRYRQWLTHKLGSWQDQFGTSGCVGCGRCITWCPPGIDLTEEVRALRQGNPS